MKSKPTKQSKQESPEEKTPIETSTQKSQLLSSQTPLNPDTNSEPQTMRKDNKYLCMTTLSERQSSSRKVISNSIKSPKCHTSSQDSLRPELIAEDGWCPVCKKGTETGKTYCEEHRPEPLLNKKIINWNRCMDCFVVYPERHNKCLICDSDKFEDLFLYDNEDVASAVKFYRKYHDREELFRKDLKEEYENYQEWSQDNPDLFNYWLLDYAFADAIKEMR
jgi:hypothetical protein